jgi:signal peptidase I
MEPSFSIGTTAWVQTQGYSPSVGDVVVFHPPEDFEQEECGPKPHVLKIGEVACDAPTPEESKIKLIKRIVAAPGDDIYVRGGHVYRRAAGERTFVREQDSYIKACGTNPECNFPTPIKIPPGHWFMMGDNRGESDDSRFWGPVPTSWIIGHVVYCTAIGTPCGERQ